MLFCLVFPVLTLPLPNQTLDILGQSTYLLPKAPGLPGAVLESCDFKLPTPLSNQLDDTIFGILLFRVNTKKQTPVKIKFKDSIRYIVTGRANNSSLYFYSLCALKFKYIHIARRFGSWATYT